MNASRKSSVGKSTLSVCGVRLGVGFLPHPVVSREPDDAHEAAFVGIEGETFRSLIRECSHGTQ